MLSVDNAANYLIDHSLISAQSIVEGDLMIVNAARRNRNLRVTCRDGAGYLIKQPDDPSFGGQYSLRCEAMFYAFCRREPAVEALQEVLPRMSYFDPDQSLIALELLPDALALWSYYSQFDAANFPVQAAGVVGRALGIAHRTLRVPGAPDDARLAWLRRDVPWILRVHKPGPELLAGISPANYRILQIIQTQERLSERLDGLGKLWQSRTVIHNDIKSDNILVTPAPADRASALPTAHLVDWELVQIGDPAWDVAGALQDMLLFWAAMMPPALAPEELVANARYPLPVLQSAIRAFWRGYRIATELTPAEANALIGRAVRFSAARLIQSAYEMAQSARDLPARSVLLLQISANILADPQAGQVQLYGLFQEAHR